MRPLNLFDLFAKISLDTSEYESGIKDVEKSGSGLASKLKSGLATAGKAAAVGIGAITTAAGAAVGGLLALESVTEEYRIAQGKLNTAFEAAGMSSETAKEAYRGFYAILGDTDTATEASQLLAQLAENEEDVATWTKISAGVLGTYGDSLPIESLIEAANETAKVGEVTGTLADALNWAGLSEEAFNAQLAACSSESERNQLIMQTLEGTYGEAAEAFYRNNEAIIAANEAQTKMDESLGKVGESVTRVKNALMEEFSPAIAEVSTKLADFISGIDTEALVENITSFVNTIVDNGPTIISMIAGIGAAFIAWNVVTTIQGVVSAITAFRAANEGATLAQLALNAAMTANPIGIVVAAITGIIAIIGTLWVTNEDFRNAVIEIWGNIKQAFVTAWENIKAAWDAAQPYFQAIWDAIQSIFSVVADVLGGFFSVAWDAIKLVWSTVTGFFGNIWNTIKGIFSVVKSVLSGNFSDAWEAIKGIFSGWKAYFEGLWEDLKGVFSGVWEWFSGIGEDIVNGIKEGISNAWNGLKAFVTNLFDGLYDDVTDNEEIHSPSKKWARIGQADALGLGEGWLDTLAQVKSQIQNDLDFGTSFMSMGQARPAFSYGYGAYPNNSANSSAANTESINITLELDGAVLARKMYTYNRTESKRRGTSLING